MEKVTCNRCGGRGYLPQYRYNGGECFGCGGAGYKLKDKAAKAKASTRKNIEYLLILDKGEIIGIEKLPEAMTLKKAIAASKEIVKGGYTQMNFCSEEDLTKAGLL